MIFWQSSEATQYGYTLISAFVREVEQKINAQLSQITLRSAYQTWKWAFIVMIMDHNDYKEIRKKNTKNKVLEFRLKMDIEILSTLKPNERIQMYFDTLQQCFDTKTIKKLQLPEHDLNLIRQALDQALNDCISHT